MKIFVAILIILNMIIFTTDCFSRKNIIEKNSPIQQLEQLNNKILEEKCTTKKL